MLDFIINDMKKKELIVLDIVTTDDGYELFKVLHAGYEGSPKQVNWHEPSHFVDGNGYFQEHSELMRWVEENEDTIIVVTDYTEH